MPNEECSLHMWFASVVSVKVLPCIDRQILDYKMSDFPTRKALLK